MTGRNFSTMFTVASYASATRHHGNPIKGPPETTQTSQHYMVPMDSRVALNCAEGRAYLEEKVCTATPGNVRHVAR